MISIDEARKAIKNGELLVYPTDTLWGIGCDPFNETAVKKLFEIKGKRENGLRAYRIDLGLKLMMRLLRTVRMI